MLGHVIQGGDRQTGRHTDRDRAWPAMDCTTSSSRL